MAHFGLLDPADEDALHAPRLLNFEEKNLKRLIKHVSEIASQISGSGQSRLSRSDESPSEESPTSNRQEDESNKQRIWRDEILLDFANFDSNIIRAQLVLNSNQQERARYAVEKIRIEETAQTVRDNNTALHEQLKEAQRTLEIRKGWDKLTEKITGNKSLKSRDEQRAQLDKLNAEIAELEAESQEYARTWAERREQFGKIVDEGTQLLRLIRDEKEEAERKDDMEDVEEDGAATPTRINRSRVATPTPHQSPRETSKLREEALTVKPLNTQETSGETNQSQEDTDIQMADSTTTELKT